MTIRKNYPHNRRVLKHSDLSRGDFSVAGDLTVTGASNITVDVSSTNDLAVENDAQVGGDLDVMGSVNVEGMGNQLATKDGVISNIMDNVHAHIYNICNTYVCDMCILNAY